MSKLFVSDDEDEVMDKQSTLDFNAQGELDDPVMTEIPLILKPKPASKRLSVLQYPGRPAHRQFQDQNPVLESRIKPSTDLIEVDVPINTEFFDEAKSKRWGDLHKQTLSGVLCNLDGYYAAQVQDGELVLVPVDSVAQLRPSLSYIDKHSQEVRETNKLDTPQNNTVQVVQMTVKGTNDTAPRLGGALMARKKVEEEQFAVLPWTDVTNTQAQLLREELLRVDNKQQLTSVVTEEEYLNMLVKETIVNQNA